LSSPAVVLGARPRGPARQRLLAPYVALCAGAALAAAAGLGGAGAIRADALTFVLLVAAVVLLDATGTRLLGSGHTAPTTVPSIALALLFGPLGVVAGEGVLALKRAALRKPAIRNAFDLGAMGLSGTAAWAVAQPLPAGGAGVLLTGLAAGVAFYAVNSVLLAVVWSLSEGGSPLALWRERLTFGAAHEIGYGPVAALLVLADHEMGTLSLALVGVPMAAIWFGQRQSMRATLRHVAELSATNDRRHRLMLTTVASLARTIEARDPYTGGHTDRVAEIALAFGRRLGMPDGELEALAIGAVIHDIGKIGVPDAVLLKRGPLDDDEWAAMRRHPEIGAYILGEIELPAQVKAMARSHHERWDGGGYPDGLAGEAIPLPARILAVADALDAMTTDRPYRTALPMQFALAELQDKAGTQFCPAVVAAALAVADGWR
jgi:hypothetical protein